MPNDVVDATEASPEPIPCHEGEPECSDPALCDTIGKRVEHIARLMSSGKWLVERKQRVELGGVWGVCDTQVKRYAAEAHRLLEFDRETREQLRLWLITDLKGQLERAKRERNEVTGLPDSSAILGAYDRIAKFASIPMDETPRDESGPALRIEIVDRTAIAPLPTAPESTAAIPNAQPHD